MFLLALGLLAAANEPVSKALEPAPRNAPLATDDGPLSRLKVTAEGRLRAESTFDQLNGDDRHRGRLRLRIGAEYQIADGLKAGARLSTLSDGRDANNPHWDFGDGADGFSAAEIGLDRFYLDWQACEELRLTGGKFQQPFARPPVLRELAWDDDVNPAGIAAVWAPKSADALSYDVRAAHVVATEVNSDAGSSGDPAMSGLQANVYYKADASTELSAGTSYAKWSSLDNFAVIDQGNTPDAGDFGVWDTYAAVTFAGEGFERVSAFVQYLQNLEDDSGDDRGYALGVQAGQTKGQGALNVFASYYDLETNSVFSPVAQDDAPIAGTGVGNGDGIKGFVFGVQYFVLENVSLRLWALTSDVGESDDPYRLRFDVDFRLP